MKALVDEILDNWQAHFFAAHPTRILQAILEDGNELPPLACRVCDSLHEQMRQAGG